MAGRLHVLGTVSHTAKVGRCDGIGAEQLVVWEAVLGQA